MDYAVLFVMVNVPSGKMLESGEWNALNTYTSLFPKMRTSLSILS